jgi:16S rRNA (guanine1207-N2)-methyltransferase
MADPDLDLLFDAEFPPGDVLFANADWHNAMGPLANRLWCLQDWKPAADRLSARNLRLGSPKAPVATALVRLGRQRARNLFNIAQALASLGPGGRLRVAGRNEIGPARYAKDLAAIGLVPIATSKGKARRLDATVTGPLDLAAWPGETAERPILDGRFVSAPGIFAWDRIDAGSAALAALLPTDLAGHVADLGAGFGYLAATALAQSPAIERLDAFEADRPAVRCAAANLSAFGARAQARWHDVTAGVGAALYDAVLTNPPFHEAHGEDRSLGLRFIDVAADALKPGGRLYLVANRHLPYEQKLDARFKRVVRLHEGNGFKIYAAWA